MTAACPAGPGDADGFTVRYSPGDLAADYARAGLGLALTVPPLLALEVVPWLAWALGGAGALFALFLAATVRRQLTRWRIDDRGIAAEGPLGGAIAWPALDRVRLRYFATRRDRSGGWMQLTLRGDGVTLSVDSTLPRFDDLTARALAAAGRNRIPLEPVTEDNLAALGLALDGADPPDPPPPR